MKVTNLFEVAWTLKKEIRQRAYNYLAGLNFLVLQQKAKNQKKCMHQSLQNVLEVVGL